jgi:hypothetical protein
MDCTASCNGHAYSLSCPGSDCAGGFDRDAGCCTVPAVTCSCTTDGVETHSWSADPELVNVDSAWAGCAYPGTFEAPSGSSSSGADAASDGAGTSSGWDSGDSSGSGEAGDASYGTGG